MSRITGALAASHRVSLAAMEEASRLGARTADIDHMLLALTLDPGIAGQVLRAQGVTLPAAREAVAAQHSEQLASLGLSTLEQPAGPIVFHETGGYQWSERALEIMKLASAKKRRGDAAAMLRELVQEPSGLVAQTLARLGATPDGITALLAAADRGRANAAGLPTGLPSGHAPAPRRPNALSARAEAFVPAPVDQVWALLSNPARMPEWEPSIASVASAPAPPPRSNTHVGNTHGSDTRFGSMHPGNTRFARARTERPDGKAIRTAPEFTRLQLELTAREEPHLVEWRITYPDSARANVRRIRISIEPAAGGTQLRLTFAWERGARRRSPRGLVLLPLHRIATRMQASLLAAGIGRAFR